MVGLSLPPGGADSFGAGVGVVVVSGVAEGAGTADGVDVGVADGAVTVGVDVPENGAVTA